MYTKHMIHSTHNSMYNQIQMVFTSLDIVTSSMGILFFNGLGYDMLARPDTYTSTYVHVQMYIYIMYNVHNV